MSSLMVFDDFMKELGVEKLTEEQLKQARPYFIRIMQLNTGLMDTCFVRRSWTRNECDHTNISLMNRDMIWSNSMHKSDTVMMWFSEKHNLDMNRRYNLEQILQLLDDLGYTEIKF